MKTSNITYQISCRAVTFPGMSIRVKGCIIKVHTDMGGRIKTKVFFKVDIFA